MVVEFNTVSPESFSLARLLRSPGLVRISSDLSRVAVKHRGAAANADFTVDCRSEGSGSAIWLRDGDEVTIP